MKFIKEFKEFAMKGNVIDMAFGVIIGGAFSKIVTSMVNDIIMPLIGMITGNFNVSAFAVSIPASAGGAPINLAVGMFLQNVIDFLIIAMCLFIAFKLIGKMKRKHEEAPAAPAQPDKTEVLLEEIRDILKEKQ